MSMEIKLNSKKIINNIIFSLVFFILCLIALVINDEILNHIRFIFIIGLFYYGYGMIVSLKQKKNTQLFTINQKGIDVKGEYGIGFIPWEEIEKISAKGNKMLRTFEIALVNEKKTLSRVLDHKSLLSNKYQGHEALSFDASYFDKDLDEVIKFCEECKKRYQKDIYGGL